MNARVLPYTENRPGGITTVIPVCCGWVVRAYSIVWQSDSNCTHSNQWREREFKVGGGTKRRRTWVCGEVFPSPPETPSLHRRGVWEGQFFWFCDLKMAYFCEFYGGKFKVFLYRELGASALSGVWVDSVANFGFSSKTMNKRHHEMLLLGEDN